MIPHDEALWKQAEDEARRFGNRDPDPFDVLAVAIDILSIRFRLHVPTYTLPKKEQERPAPAPLPPVLTVTNTTNPNLLCVHCLNVAKVNVSDLIYLCTQCAGELRRQLP